MTRRHLGLLAALACAWACKGLYVDQGNNFPCDFTQPPGIRDQACSPGEICGLQNHCQRFVYEGPQFEGVPTRPEKGGGKIHPLILDQPVQAVSVSPYDRSKVQLVMTGDDGVTRLYGVDLQQSSLVVAGDPVRTDSGFVQELAYATDGGLLFLFNDGGIDDSEQGDDDGGADGGGASGNQRLAVQNGLCVFGPKQNLGQCVPGVRHLRSGNAALGLLRNAHDNNSGGTVDDQNQYLPFSFEAPDAGYGDGGGVIAWDFLWVKRGQTFGDGGDEQIPLVLESDGFWAPLDDALTNWVNLIGPGEVPEPLNAPAFFRRNEGHAVWAMGFNSFDINSQASGNRLSTWLRGELIATPTPAFARAWADCTPCARISGSDGGTTYGTIVGMAPVHDGAPGVEVLCSVGGVVSLVTVTGSTAADVSQSCVEQTLPLPFDAKRLQIRPDAKPGVSAPVQDLTNGFYVALGGQHGEVWDGFSFSVTLPLFLERVPLATGVLQLDGGAFAAVAVTDSYIASNESNNGFKAFRILDSDGNLVQPRASMGSAPGWFIDAQGRTLQMTQRPGMSPVLAYGPNLLNAHGDPALSPFFGEAFDDPYGNLVSFVMAADDSLYLAPFPAASSDPTPSKGLLPVLSPEPNVPIRSFTLERTPIGTDGIDRVRGYLVTSRDVFEFELSGTPPRWSTTLLPLSAGEPLEVWMDNPRGGLGRVGYRDGTVLTLPGGFLLAPGVDSQGHPLSVLDYENYGGWPVAYTSTGLFVAEWDYDGGLLNKTDAGVPSLPMSWRPLTLPDSGTPWLAGGDGGARPAKLQVVNTTAFFFPDGGAAVPFGYVPDFAHGEQLESQEVFELLVYLDDAVYQVGQMQRFNKHQVQPADAGN